MEFVREITGPMRLLLGTLLGEQRGVCRDKEKLELGYKSSDQIVVSKILVVACKELSLFITSPIIKCISNT